LNDAVVSGTVVDGARVVDGAKVVNGGRKGKFSGKNHFMYGKHLSEETRRKISEAMKGEE